MGGAAPDGNLKLSERRSDTDQVTDSFTLGPDGKPVN